MAPTLKILSINPNAQVQAHPDIISARNAAGQSGYVWVDLCEPDPQTMESLANVFGLHPLSVEDALNEDQLPKLENFPSYSFMIFNIFETTPEEVLSKELDLFLGRDFLISVSRESSQGRPLLAGISALIESNSQRVEKGPTYLMHMIVDMIVDRKFNAVETIEDRLDGYEDIILSDFRRFNLAHLMDSRRDLLTIRKSLFHEREVMGKIIRQDSPFIEPQSMIYFRDIYDHLSKYYEMSDSARDLVTSLMEIHLSMISNHMAASANRTNAIMRRLTLITTIFMPLSLISGIGGMSEFTMMTGGEENWKIAYLVLILVMLAIAALNLIAIKRMERDLPSNTDDL